MPYSRPLSGPIARLRRGWRRIGCTLTSGLLLAVLLLAPGVAESVLIATGDGTGNTTAPPDDPGYANVGIINGLSGTYVGNGWVLTASHVGAKPIDLLGVVYSPVPGSRVQFSLPGQTADLIAFKLLGPDPPLPALALTDSAPTNGTLVTMIGNGVIRGTPTSWQGHDGWNWGGNRLMRWGTNRIANASTEVIMDNLTTQAFQTVFDDLNPNPPAGEHEADMVPGDSGGAVFTGGAGTAELIGILFARLPVLQNQPASTSIYTSLGFAVDLYDYRNDILAVVGQPECSDGLDDDGDGLTDYPDDVGCTDAADTDERGAAFECDNGLDDDGDTFSDFPADPDCSSVTDDTEAPEVPSARFGGGALAVALLLKSQQALRRLPKNID